jgi:heme o synthase
MTLLKAARSYLGLCKATLSFFVAMSAATGFLLADHPTSTVLPALITGIFLMACGAGALNHCQEWKTDALMSRTSRRPIPAGRIQPSCARRFSMVLIGSGAIVLLSAGGWSVPLLGIAAVFGYNGFYTWAKRRYAFAAIPGALIGAIPPAMGWLAGGGYFDTRLAVVCFFFFMWQVSHFLIHQKIFGKEYEAIRLPAVTAVLAGSQIDRLMFQWLLAAAVSLQLVTLQGLIHSSLIHLSLLAASLGLIAGGISILVRHAPNYSAIFSSTNAFMLAAMTLILIDRFPCCLGPSG